MYFLDGIIAFFVPANRVKKTLLDPVNIDTIAKHYGQGIYEKVRPTLKEDAEKIIDSIYSKMESHINNKIQILCTNDLPHMMEDKLQIVKDDIPIHLRAAMTDSYQMIDEKLHRIQKDIQSDLLRAMSSAGTAQKSFKSQERLDRMKQISMLNPQLGIGLTFAKKNMSASEFDMFLDAVEYSAMSSAGGAQIGQNEKEMPTLRAGARVPQVPCLQEEGKRKETNMGQISDEEAKKILKKQLDPMQFKALEEAKKLADTKKIEGENNG